MPIFNVLSQPFRSLHLPPPGSFTNQTVLITGANTGLGFATAQHILNLGASKVILGVRTVSKGNDAKARLEAATTNLTAEIEVWEVDLSSFASVKAFAARAEKLQRLDAAILNAGLASGKFQLSDEGWEMQMQVNVLSTALLGLLLLPILIRTRNTFPEWRPHLVVVGSDIHADCKFEERKSENVLEAMNDEALWEKSMKAGPVERYATSKLLGMYAALKLARITPMINGEPAIVVDIVAPGFCKSELLSREEGAPFLLVAVQSMVGRTLEEGSKTLVDAALRGPEAHGKFLDHQKIARMAPLIVSEEGEKIRTQVWGEILGVLGRIAPEILSTAAVKA
jgi:NAD(P)-dependent dehydrogenase (short-subunit alcohol dehydrogenase family)